MNIKNYCGIMGGILLALGLLGFVPALAPAQSLPEPSTTGMLFGLFPINALHNLVHIGFGIWGLTASRQYDSSYYYTVTSAIIFGVLAVLGMVPALNTLFGLVPLHGHVVWLHAVIAASGAYFAYDYTNRRTTMGPTI